MDHGGAEHGLSENRVLRICSEETRDPLAFCLAMTQSAIVMKELQKDEDVRNGTIAFYSGDSLTAEQMIEYKNNISSPLLALENDPEPVLYLAEMEYAYLGDIHVWLRTIKTDELNGSLQRGQGTARKVEFQESAYNMLMALNKMHEQNYYHNDIKLKNIMAFPDQKPDHQVLKLIDFDGMCKADENIRYDGRKHFNNCVSGRIIYTRDYVVPYYWMRNFEGPVKWFTNNDIWELAVAFYYMLHRVPGQTTRRSNWKLPVFKLPSTEKNQKGRDRNMTAICEQGVWVRNQVREKMRFDPMYHRQYFHLNEDTFNKMKQLILFMFGYTDHDGAPDYPEPLDVEEPNGRNPVIDVNVFENKDDPSCPFLRLPTSAQVMNAYHILFTNKSN